MRKQFAMLTIAFLMSAYAVAEVQEASSLDESFSASITGEAAQVEMLKGGACSQIKATDAQKTALKAAFQQFEASKKTLEANAKTAHMNYFKLVSDAKADFATAQAAATAVSNTVSDMMAAKLAFKTQVLFQILTPEQRGPAIKCEMQHRKHRKHRGGKGGGHKGGHKKPAPKAAIDEISIVE